MADTFLFCFSQALAEPSGPRSRSRSESEMAGPLEDISLIDKESGSAAITNADGEEEEGEPRTVRIRIAYVLLLVTTAVWNDEGF